MEAAAGPRGQDAHAAPRDRKGPGGGVQEHGTDPHGGVSAPGAEDGRTRSRRRGQAGPRAPSAVRDHDPRREALRHDRRAHLYAGRSPRQPTDRAHRPGRRVAGRRRREKGAHGVSALGKLIKSS